jgi:fumarylacetoacetate (FAA) hydrolase
MKLATLKDGSRDGQLVVVSRDLSLAHHANGIANRLQQVLDDWNFLSPQLEDLYATLNGGKARHAFAFDPRQCMAPLPRAYHWVPGPQLAPGSGNGLLGPCDEAFFVDAQAEIGFAPGLAVVTGDIPLGATPGQALDGVRLLLLVNHWLAHPHPDDDPAPAFGPVAATPDELGDGWREGRARLTWHVSGGGTRWSAQDAGNEGETSFGERLAALARARPLRAGSIVGNGPGGESPRRLGPLRAGDAVHVEACGPDGQSIFGAIAQRVAGRASPPPEVDSAATG